MVIESCNFSEVAFYKCGSYVEVLSFDLVFKKLLRNQSQSSQDIKLHTSAGSTLTGIRYSSKYYQAGCHSFAPYHNNSITRLQLEFRWDKYWNSVEIITTNVKERTRRDYKIENVVCEKWYATDNVYPYNYDDCEQGGSIFVEIYCDSSVKTKLHKTLNDLLISKLFSDVVIVSSDGKNFNVHKNIISCNSEVFKAHFLHETEENTTGKIMSTFDAEVVTELLGYMYSEEVNNMSSLSERLLAAADFYNLDDLKGQCELYISKHLNVDNAIEVYKLADLHSASYLKKKCKKFIHMFRKEILESTAWAEFEPSALMKELLDYFLQTDYVLSPN